MKILLRQVLIADSSAPFNGLIKDILVTNGKIVKIADSISEPADQIIEKQNTVVSQGWVDPFVHFCDPGYEFKETLETGANAAAAGGFTQVFTLPNTNPVVQSKSQVEYIVQKSKSLPADIHPLGALSKNCDGKELAEMYDMHASGAIAFSDGTHPVQSAGLLVKALQYVKAFNGVVIQLPEDTSIAPHGLMNEGIISTRLGLPGKPIMAEELMVARDIKLARYTDSKLHFTGVTSAKSLEYILRAKEGGLKVTCSVTPYHLFLCDEDLLNYDTNLKVNPPLRSKKDRMALREGIMNGIIDCITSHHLPQDWDNKVCEFEYAKPGITGLETSFAVINHLLPELSNKQVSDIFSNNIRNIFSLPTTSITENASAELTLFNRSAKTVVTKENLKSKSHNTPFLNTELKGKVIGTIYKGKAFINQY